MAALVVWLVAYLIGGAPEFGYGDPWFWFLAACTALAFAQAIAVSRIGRSEVNIFNPEPLGSSEQDEGASE